MAKTAREGAEALQRAAADKLKASEKAAQQADRESDEAKKLELLSEARAEALAAKELSKAAKTLARGRRP